MIRMHVREQHPVDRGDLCFIVEQTGGTQVDDK